MCMLKSVIILEDRIFCPDYDSHTNMLKELKIEDTEENAKKLFVRAELSPTDGDPFSDLSAWRFSVDQDIFPDWYVKEFDEQRVREAVAEWASGHVFNGVDGLLLSTGSGYYIKDCKNVAVSDNAVVECISGNAVVKCISDNAVVECISGNAVVKCISGNAVVKYISGNAVVERICGSAVVECISGNAVVERICGSAVVECIYGSAVVECIYGSAVVKYISGNAVVECISDNAVVKCISGNAVVKYISGNAVVECISGNAVVKCISGNAVVKYISGNAVVERICGSAVVISSQFPSWKNKLKMQIGNNATFKDKESKTIYQAGDWKFVAVEGKQ